MTISRVIEDRVLFLWPKDRELQFAAAAVIGEFIDTYNARMAGNTPVAPGSIKPEFKLIFDVDVAEADWEFFKEIGYKPSIERTLIDRRPDAIFDLREERVMQFYDSGKHVAGAMGLLVGVETLPLPKIRRVRPKMTEPYEWLHIDESSMDHQNVTDMMVDDRWIGIVIQRGWESYLAASIGMPVIELDHVENRFWLSKWTNKVWRRVDLNADNVAGQISQAKAELEGVIACLAAARDKNKETMPMDQSTSTAIVAASS